MFERNTLHSIKYLNYIGNIREESLIGTTDEFKTMKKSIFTSYLSRRIIPLRVESLG